MRTAALLLAATLASVADAAPEAPVAILGGTVLPSPTAAPLRDGVVLLQGGKVLAVGTAKEVSIPPNATRVDAKGLTVAAGFWNCHVHFTGPDWANAQAASPQALSAAMEKMLTRYGFTTVLDAGSGLVEPMAVRARVEKGDVPGPRILAAGEPLFPKDGIPIYVRQNLPPDVVKHLFNPATPEKARAEVARNLAGGADAIKVFAGTWLGGSQTAEMPLDVLRAVVEAGHEAKKPVLSHPQTLGGVRNSLAAGVDVLMHTTPGSGPWPKELVSALVAAHMGLVPTLGLWSVVARQSGMKPDAAESYVQAGVGQLRAFFQAGGEVLFGTDVGYQQVTDTGEELVRMAQAGLSWRDVLASLTTAPAHRFGGAGTGTLAPGEPADVVLFRGDPMRAPRAYSQVVLSYRAGKVLYRAPK